MQFCPSTCTCGSAIVNSPRCRSTCLHSGESEVPSREHNSPRAVVLQCIGVCEQRGVRANA
eukprot:6190523-Pleurochrysis_carterae.AAC.3